MYHKIQKIFGYNELIQSTQTKLFIHCPKCNETIYENHLLQIGLYCSCGCDTFTLFEACVVKYGWACYIIQDGTKSLCDQVDYVGISSRGRERLLEQRHKFKDTSKVIRCSLRLGETDILQLFNPAFNIQKLGNHLDSSKTKIGNTDVEFGIATPQFVRMCFSLSHKNVFIQKEMMSSNSAGLLIKDSRLRFQPDWCMLKNEKICSHPLPCKLKKYINLSTGKNWYFPFDKHLVKEIIHRNNYKGQCFPVQKWNLDNILKVRLRGLDNHKTIQTATSQIRSMFRIGLLHNLPSISFRDWVYIVTSENLKTSNVSSRFSNFSALFYRLTSPDQNSFFGISRLYELHDAERLSYSSLIKFGLFWDF